MDIDTVAIGVSLLGMGMSPFWAKWSAQAILRDGCTTTLRVAAVVVTSLAILGLVHVGPWFALMIHHGTLWTNLTEPMFPVGMAILFGPGVILQTGCALSFSRRPAPARLAHKESSHCASSCPE